MAKLIMRQEAINDLTTIWNYTAKHWSENQADTYYEMLKTACNEIAHNSKTNSGLKVSEQFLIDQLILEEYFDESTKQRMR